MKRQILLRPSGAYLIGSWSSLSSLLWRILMPLFLARGQPDRLQDRRRYVRTYVSVVAPCRGRRSAATVPPVGGVVSCDVSRSIAAGRRTPEVHTHTHTRRLGHQRHRRTIGQGLNLRTHLSSCELVVIIPRRFLSASWQLDNLREEKRAQSERQQPLFNGITV